MNRLTPHQKRSLSENPIVLKFTENHVVFTSAFKVKAVELYFGGAAPDEIFINHGIDPSIFKVGYCRHCIKRWKNKYNAKGKHALKEDSRGSRSTGRPREDLESLGNDDLRAIIAIQKELIEQLKKKKALVKKR